MRYTIKTGSYGSYFYDNTFNRPLPLSEVQELLNKTVKSKVTEDQTPRERTQEELFALMRRKGITQKALAKYLKCSHQRISEFNVNKPDASKWQPGELYKAFRWVSRQ